MISALKRSDQERTRSFAHVDWFLFGAALAISLIGAVTMRSFSIENSFFEKQIIWISIAVGVFFLASLGDYNFLRRTPIIVGLYVFVFTLLSLIFVFGGVVKGSQNRFDLGLFAVQPADPAKLILVAVLAKYFGRRHVEIKHYRHILVSGAYAGLLFMLVLLQPEFGSAIAIFGIWFGMALISGISWKHVAALLISVAIVFSGLWTYALKPYQKARIETFIHPLADIRGTGYNAYQSTVAVGSGEIFGKGIGYGTQSKLQFLPEFQTDFIFAAYAEEWGFFGVLMIFALFGIVIIRILAISIHAPQNFETLFAAGVAVYFLAQFIVHVGMNIGLMPITGTTLPFMSYGGSHLLVEYTALGILMGIRRHGRPIRHARDSSELIGAV